MQQEGSLFEWNMVFDGTAKFEKIARAQDHNLFFTSLRILPSAFILSRDWLSTYQACVFIQKDYSAVVPKLSLITCLIMLYCVLLSALRNAFTTTKKTENYELILTLDILWFCASFCYVLLHIFQMNKLEIKFFAVAVVASCIALTASTRPYKGVVGFTDIRESDNFSKKKSPGTKRKMWMIVSRRGLT